jgi:hypothetical protein
MVGIYAVVDSLSSFQFLDFWWYITPPIFSLQHVGYVPYTYKDGMQAHKME